MAKGAASSEPEDDRSGEVLQGKYEVLRRIGSGGMGVVYEAIQKPLNRRVAVKFLSSEQRARAKTRERFEREAMTTAALSHENLVSVLDVGIADDGTPYIVMEYLEGENLRDLSSREGTLAVPRAIDIVVQACRALAMAHANGVIHRDLKPENLMIQQRPDGSEHVKVLDFGIARLVHPSEPALTTTNAVLGTPHYMSPEQGRGASVDHRSDIYSLGCILYELLSAELVHPGDSYNAVIHHLLTQPVIPIEALRSDLPRGLSDVIARALHPDVEQRFDSAAALATALQECLRRRPTAALATEHATLERSAPAQAVSTIRKRPHSKTWLTVGAVALLASGIGFFVGRSGPAPEPEEASPSMVSTAPGTPAATGSVPAVPTGAASQPSEPNIERESTATQPDLQAKPPPPPPPTATTRPRNRSSRVKSRARTAAGVANAPGMAEHSDSTPRPKTQPNSETKVQDPPIPSSFDQSNPYL